MTDNSLHFHAKNSCFKHIALADNPNTNQENKPDRKYPTDWYAYCEKLQVDVIHHEWDKVFYTTFLTAENPRGTPFKPTWQQFRYRLWIRPVWDREAYLNPNWHPDTFTTHRDGYDQTHLFKSEKPDNNPNFHEYGYYCVEEKSFTVEIDFSWGFSELYDGSEVIKILGDGNWVVTKGNCNGTLFEAW